MSKDIVDCGYVVAALVHATMQCEVSLVKAVACHLALCPNTTLKDSNMAVILFLHIILPPDPSPAHSDPDPP